MTAILTQSAPTTRAESPGMLEPRRLARAKRAFTTRNVAPLHSGHNADFTLLTDVRPTAGDLVLATVTELGQHGRLELPDGRRATLRAGDEVVAVYGARYAPDQFEGLVPDDLGPCDLLAAGGVAGRCVAKSDRVDEPTRLRPSGILAHGNRPIRLRDWAPLGGSGTCGTNGAGSHRPRVLGIAGTAMNAGKTTVMAALVRGLSEAGLRVWAVKATGTGAGGDLWHCRDAGAEWVRDFTDAGHPTTYQVGIAELERISGELIRDAAAHSADVVLVEVADGLYQDETAALLKSRKFHGRVDGMVFAANDALGATAGARWLREHDYPLHAVSGALTASPLALRETEDQLGELVTASSELTEPAKATAVLDGRHRAPQPSPRHGTRSAELCGER